MRTNQEGLELIKRHEGLRLAAYLCPAKVWTIGYGHTGDVKPEHRITEHQADVLLAHDLAGFEADVAELTRGIPLNENEFSALVSFAFNVGTNSFTGSTLLRLLLKNTPTHRQLASMEFLKWVHGGGKMLPGLVKRREDERALFLKPVGRENVS